MPWLRSFLAKEVCIDGESVARGKHIAFFVLFTSSFFAMYYTNIADYLINGPQ